VPTVIALALRNWKLIGAGLLVLALGIQELRVRSRDGVIERQRNELAAMRAQFQVIEDEARRRSEAAQRALEEARRANQAQQGLIDNLRRSAARPRDPNAPCTISPELRAAEGAL
jgi:hypothetical protein